MEQAHHIRHKAVDWNNIAQRIPGDTDEFKGHLARKSADACDRKGPDFVFGETVNDKQATDIRKISREQGYKEITGGE